MVKNLNKNHSFFHSIITIVLAVFIVTGIVWADWSPPVEEPPAGNLPAPINAGPESQVKAGNLWVRSLGVDVGLVVENGNVGLGTLTPSERLDVNGRIHATGDICTDLGAPGGVCLSTGGGSGTITGSGTTNRIPIWSADTVLGNSPFSINATDESVDFAGYKLRGVREIDPVFNILEKKYTSYVPDMIGQKIEVIGQDQLIGDKIEIDLSKESEGSDLWLFWQTVDQDSVIPFISAQSNAILFSYLNGSNFVIELREGEENAKFSYRLIGVRLDHADDLNNLYDDQDVEHFIDIDSLRK